VTGWAHALLRVHLLLAFSATAAFWLAAVSSKGGSRHRWAGRWFRRLIYGAAGTGAALAIATLVAPAAVRVPDPSASAAALEAAARQTRQLMWFTLYVVLIIVAPVQHGLAVVAAGAQPARLRTAPHLTLCVLAMLSSVVLLPTLVVWQQVTWLVVAPIGFVVGLRQMAYAARTSATPEAWRREHLTSLLTAGITLHTTLLVFGAARILKWPQQGWQMWLPWIAPALIGLPVILWLARTRRPRAAS
jgi:hypothetical protein